MALTEEQMIQRMNQVDMALVGLLEMALQAMEDNPETEKDESNIDFWEGTELSGYTVTVVLPAFRRAIRDLDGASRREIIEAYKNRGKM